VAERLAEEPGVNVVQILGRTVLLYKRHPQKPRFEGKGPLVEGQIPDADVEAGGQGVASDFSTVLNCH